MVFSNLMRAISHVIPFKGQHVQEVRQTILDDGNVLLHQGSMDSAYEKAARKCKPLVPPPTITELVNSGEKPKVLGGLGNVSVLDDAQFAQAWLARFNAAANMPAVQPVSAEQPVSAVQSVSVAEPAPAAE